MMKKFTNHEKFENQNNYINLKIASPDGTLVHGDTYYEISQLICLWIKDSVGKKIMNSMVQIFFFHRQILHKFLI